MFNKLVLGHMFAEIQAKALILYITLKHYTILFLFI